LRASQSSVRNNLAILLIGAGEIGSSARLRKRISLLRKTSDLQVIAVDGGYSSCAKLGLAPDLLIGDMDSISPAQFRAAKRRAVRMVSYSSDKDQSDLALALEYARGLARPLVRRHSSPVVIAVGVTGGREDHHQAALLEMAHFSRQSKLKTMIWGARSDWFFLSRSVQVSIELKVGQTVSVFSTLGSIRGLSTKGLKWAGNKVKILRPGSLGLSNRVVTPQIKVSVSSGAGVVVVPFQS
jgi:thiamine pyrophosphokinase